VDEFGHLRVFSMQVLPQVTGLPPFNWRRSRLSPIAGGTPVRAVSPGSES